jgi:tRNA(fMet)-specific endonuclease VapC
MIYLPDTNTCISLLRQKQPALIARWQSTKSTEITLCSIVVYELRHGAESSSNPAQERGKLDVFLAPFSSLPFDDACGRKCAEIRRALERKGERIGPHDLQIAAIALQHGLTLVTHNVREFSRIAELRLEDWESLAATMDDGA